MKTITQPTTHIESVRANDCANADNIQQLLGWTHPQYCEHQFEQYERFCKRMFEGYPVIQNEVRYSALFRGLWNNEWALRNETLFLRFARATDSNDADLIDEYLYLHGYQRLMNDREFIEKYNQVLKLIRKGIT